MGVGIRKKFIRWVHVGFFALAATVHLPMADAAGPVAFGEASRPVCTEAMQLARAVFDSTAPRLYAPLRLPEGLPSRLVLGELAEDLSGGDALKASPAFDVLPRSEGRAYWAREADGLRLVIEAGAMGWRGDLFDAYLLDPGVTPSAFEAGRAARRSGVTGVIGQSWLPPLVFQPEGARPMWFIDVGQPFDVLGDWRVFTVRSVKPVCTINFRPRGGDLMAQAPAPVRELARALDESLGPGRDEGTLQPTARQRLAARHVLANMLYRPWALTDAEAYNSREEVDAGLEAWARVNGARRRLHGRVLGSYARAERALAGHYSREHGLAAEKADAMAGWALDLAMRTHFVFPRGDFKKRTAVPNPWPR